MDFTSGFWPVYILVMVIISISFVLVVLVTQTKMKIKKGEKVEVTGHKWDGDLEEYNNPLPGWWVVMFYMTIVFAVGYLIMYPGSGVSQGKFGWSSHGQHASEVAAANQKFGPIYAEFAKTPIPELAKNEKAELLGKRLFQTYCIQCHGSDARGAKGYPNLTDKTWLWGGTPEKITETISHGRVNQMPAFGVVLGEEKVRDVANYVLKISGNKHNDARATRGEIIFKTAQPLACASCHGPDGKGNPESGIPNLTDKDWLYGVSEATIVETITNGRQNQMPAWKEFLGDDKVHLLAAYVYGLNAKQDK
ncbi:cytochrome-c oxidase, cbb3-type subunit III [Chitinilyticum piscinae]|uniref:Cbb3-type cytochrome c oxidase subunit n=1 Tax=Chitinilyticum piscinae TaxID=2866724 RepID=A0A8J7K1U4_9NEIS|nr:cytochrome-c oxidase, cbb3-type subunit III [Chitinilyticum piscinae]MBE9609701.1 cytochrome-c oxidase, cbb3-type subunit III [Chitinilyticum piscinae]